MKKFLVFIFIAVVGYFTYEYFIKEKQVLEVKADKVVNTNFSMDAEAPAISPAYYATVQGTVKNVTEKTVTNIVLKYLLDGKPVEAIIYSLAPGEQQSFSTQGVMVRGAGVPFYLEKMSYE